MMNRREMFRTMGLVAAGLIAADQLEILDRLAPRSLFASADIASPWPPGVLDCIQSTTIHGLHTSSYRQWNMIADGGYESIITLCHAYP